MRLPLPTGNAPVTIRGQPGARPLLDFGGALGLSHHNASTVWVMENLHIQVTCRGDLACAARRSAAGVLCTEEAKGWWRCVRDARMRQRMRLPG